MNRSAARTRVRKAGNLRPGRTEVSALPQPISAPGAEEQNVVAIRVNSQPLYVARHVQDKRVVLRDSGLTSPMPRPGMLPPTLNGNVDAVKVLP